MTRTQDTADLPLGRPCRPLLAIFPRDSLRTAGPNEPAPISSMRRLEARSVCREKLRASKQYMSRGGVQHFLAAVSLRARRRVLRREGTAVAEGQQAFESSRGLASRNAHNDAQDRGKKNSVPLGGNHRNPSRRCRYDVNALSQVRFSCPTGAPNLSIHRMAQGFLRCCRAVTCQRIFSEKIRRNPLCGWLARQPGHCATDSVIDFALKVRANENAGLMTGVSSAKLLMSIICRAWRPDAPGARPCGSPRCDEPRPSVRRA